MKKNTIFFVACWRQIDKGKKFQANNKKFFDALIHTLKRKL